jgi:UDP-3-O-[3-hydroxymyristoyl] N-acetylglucosamine deacetylase
MAGIGVHKGETAKIRVLPAPCDYGVRFMRTDVVGVDPMVEARFDAVIDTALCTRIGNKDGVSVSTIEHLMAALAGCGVDNALVELDGPEIPIMDGSAAPFVSAILGAGVIEQDEPLRVLRILSSVSVEHDGRFAALHPSDAFEIDFKIDFEDEIIGVQHRSDQFTGDCFIEGYADSRTFGRLEDIEKLRSLGFARGGSLDNAVVVDGANVLNKGGLRHADEFVRHKMLDAVGDLALAGAPIVGRYCGVKSGHDMTNRLLHKLFETEGAWRFEVIMDRAAVAPDHANSVPYAEAVGA